MQQQRAGRQLVSCDHLAAPLADQGQQEGGSCSLVPPPVEVPYFGDHAHGAPAQLRLHTLPQRRQLDERVVVARNKVKHAGRRPQGRPIRQGEQLRKFEQRRAP